VLDLLHLHLRRLHLHNLRLHLHLHHRHAGMPACGMIWCHCTTKHSLSTTSQLKFLGGHI
jgi:hypothetical protein